LEHKTAVRLQLTAVDQTNDNAYAVREVLSCIVALDSTWVESVVLHKCAEFHAVPQLSVASVQVWLYSSGSDMLPAGSCHSVYKAVIQDNCWSLLAYIRLNLVLTWQWWQTSWTTTWCYQTKNGSTDFEIDDAQKP